MTDHGGINGCELNLIEAGVNCGWPAYTFGGGDNLRAVAKDDFVDPVLTWGVALTVALPGLEIYAGDDVPA